MKIWVSGSIARDVIMDFPGKFAEHIDPKKIHILNLSFGVKNLDVNVGGTAGNISYNLALLGERPEIVGNIGDDQKWLVDYYKKLGIGTGCIQVSKKLLTSVAHIITDRDDNQITAFYKGAMDMSSKLPRVSAEDWGIVASENQENMARLSAYYAKKKINYIFDPGQAIIALSDSQIRMGIKRARILIGNDYEIGRILKRLRSAARNDLVIIRTLGAKGSEILIKNKKIKIGIAKPAKVVDPTGAGDAYRAGLLKGLILGYNIKESCELGATVASYAVEKYGTQNHKFTWKGVVKRFINNFR